MARTDQQAFLDAYLGGGISANRSKVKSAGSTGTAAMNAGANVSLPSLYDFTDDVTQVGMAYVEAAQKQQEAAAKAAQQAAKKAQQDAEKAQKKAEKQQKKQENQAELNAAIASLGGASRKTSTAPAVKQTDTRKQEKSTAPTGKNKYVVSKVKVPTRGMDLPNTIRNSTHGRLGDAGTSRPSKAAERPASAYDVMTTSEKLAAAQELSVKAKSLQGEIEALERQKLEPKMGAGAYDEEAYAIVQKNRQIVEQQEALEAQRKQVNDQISEVSDALWNDPEYAASIQTEIDAKPESQRIEQYLVPSYKLNKLEEEDAKKIADRLIKEAYDVPRGATQGQLSDAFDKEVLGRRLNEKISNAAAISAGVVSAIPFAEEADRALSNWLLGENAEKYQEDIPSLENFVEGAKTQSPVAFTAGNIGGNLALYSVGSSAARSIPALQRVGEAAAATPVAQALQKVPVLGRLGTADAITGIYGDTLVDLTLDTVPNLGNDIAAYNRQQELIDQGLSEGKTMEEMLPSLEEYQGEYLTPGGIAADTLKGIGTNLAFNLGGELVPELLKVGGQKLRNEFASIPSLDDGAQTAARVVGNTDVPSLDDTAQAVRGGIDDVVSAWRSGTLTNAQLETLKPGGVNRAAFEQATGVKLPDTSSETRRVLRGVSPEQTKIGTVDNLSGFSDVVDDVFNGKASFNKTIVIGQTPDVYQSLGASPLNITIEPSTLYKIAYPEGYLNGKHNLGIPALKMLPVQIDNPVAILKSKTQPNSFIILTEWADTQGRPVIIPLHLDKNGAISVENKVASAYGHNHVSSLLGENNQNVLWTKGNEDIDQLLSHRLQLPQAVVDDTLVSNYSIPTLERNVNAQQIPSLEPDMPAGTVAADNAPPSLYDGLPESIGAMRHNPRSYAGMQVEYGTIAPGENAARVVDVPISTNGTDRVSASARTFIEAPQTTDELVGMFEKGVEDGLFSHNVKRDADSLARAVSKVEQDGYQKTLEYWKGLMRDGASLNKEQIVQGQLLYTLAAKNGDTETAMKLAGDLARIATEAGQNLQAQRLLKRMTPEGKLYYAQQTVDSFNRQLKQQLGDGFQDIKIPEELTRPLMEATDAKAQNDAMQNIYQYVADQLPTDWGTRWNAWRYLSMLSNPATHIRNVLSNAVNIPARKFKNLIGAAIESHYVKKGKLDPSQRTKAFLWNSESDKALKAFAKKDLDNVMGDLTGAKKYSDKGEILSRADPFKINGQWGKTDASGAVARGARAAADKATGALSWLYRANSNALSAEDMLFKRSAYVDSLAGYLKAQGIDPAKATQKQLDAAREYAVEEALRATYTEYNKLAETISMFEKRHPVGKVFIGGVVPFKSTPLNIIRRGVNYSPAGLVMNTVTGFINLKNGKITASQFIDNISQGLSGTSIFLLGTWFGMNGYINSVGPENKKEQLLKSGQGFQSYSINLLWGGTYTIDWAGPSAMALLAGAQLGKEFENEDLSFDDVVNAALNVIEPAFDTTMLSGINSAIQSATYAGNNEAVSAATQAFSNFFTQGVPSISGAIARAYDPIRRTVYSESDGAFGKIKENVQRMQNKIPVQSTQNQPYIDVWGREQENPGGSFVGRLAYNMLSPGYYSPDRRTVADDVVEDLYQQTGDTGMLPGLFGNSVTVDGEKIRLSPDDYTLAKQTKGQASNQMIESLYDYPQYNMADTEVQADVVKGVYDLANDVAKYQVVPSLYDELVSDIESGDASKSEMLAAMYLTGGAEQVIPYLVGDSYISQATEMKREDTGEEDARLSNSELYSTIFGIEGMSTEEQARQYMNHVSGDTVDKVYEAGGYDLVAKYAKLNALRSSMETQNQANDIYFLDYLGYSRAEKMVLFRILWPKAKTNPWA